jgi:hypothetical protein
MVGDRLSSEILNRQRIAWVYSACAWLTYQSEIWSIPIVSWSSIFPADESRAGENPSSQLVAL